MTERPCPRHPNRMAAPGLHVCSSVASQAEWLGCLERLEADLRYIADHWGDLEGQHFATTTQSQLNTAYGSRPPCNLSVIEATDVRGTTHGDEPIALVVQAWCRVVVEDRRLVPPTDTRNQARWLLRQAEWLCGQDFAEEPIDELRQAARALAGLIGDRDQGQWIRCPTEGCTGTLRVDMGQLRQQWHESEPEVTCRRCGQGTSPSMLMRMANSGDVDGWADAEAIEVATGISRATLDRWAKAGRIKREHGRFLLAEVAGLR